MTTVIACQETGMMAADSQVTTSGGRFVTMKIRRIGNHLLGFAGDAVAVQMFFRQYAACLATDCLNEMLPIETEEGIEGLVLTPDGMWFYEKACVGIQIEDAYYAIGGGGSDALAAMKTMELIGVQPDPIVALRVACALSEGSSEPLQIEFLED